MSTLWVYLSTSPLLWLCLTLGAYRAALAGCRAAAAIA